MNTHLESTSDPASIAGKFLTVVLASESYGIPVLQVREIIRLQKITPVPQMPDSVKGVINLRGRVIPVLDLRAKFGLAAEFAARTCIVVAQINAGAGRTLWMGVVVDAVEEVVLLRAADIERPPEFGTGVDTRYLRGMAKVNGRLKLLLDLDRVVAVDAVCPGEAA
jgi:purine-binding chemotaxis protein CheW